MQSIIYTEPDTRHSKNLRYAQKLLLKAKEVIPKNTKVYQLLSRSYLKLFKFLNLTMLIPSNSYLHLSMHDESYTTIPPTMKKIYMKYVKLCKEQNIIPKLTKEEKLIVNRSQMFIELYSDFKGMKRNYLRLEDAREKEYKKGYKKGYKNICKEYVEMLQISLKYIFLRNVIKQYL